MSVDPVSKIRKLIDSFQSVPDEYDSTWKSLSPTLYRISVPPVIRFDIDSRRAADENVRQQWAALVDDQHGGVLLGAKVFIDGKPHYHKDYVVARAHSLHEHCDLCYAVSRKEHELRGFRGHLADVPRMAYELEVVRRTTPRQRKLVPLPVPVPRTNSARIRKKWAKRAAGKTAWAYVTETIHIQMSKGTLQAIQRAYVEREKHGPEKHG